MNKPNIKFERKNLWMLEVAALLIGLFFIIKYYPADNAQVTTESGAKPAVQTSLKQTSSAPLKLEAAVVCLDVDQQSREPLLPKSSFNHQIKYLYCHTTFSGNTPAEVTHYWIYDDRIVQQETAKLQFPGGIAWTRLNVPADRRGAWRVDIEAGGKKLGSTSFRLR